ncbi:MAG: M20/M25/M40 family metallo-hydrolase [Bacteroidia bacterium]|nr:M20/M25/M40 family metallo-hydrolase [Bacteroidia bacterium]
MRVYFLFFAFLFSFEINAQTNDSIMLRKIYDHYLTESKSYKNLEYLATKIGGRLSGSKKAEEAVYWAKKALYDAGADTVYLQPCTVPHWERGGKEICKVVSPGAKNGQLAVVALGSSTCTPKGGITADVVRVRSFDELEKLGESKIKGKIVFYDVAFDDKLITPGSAYGATVKYRTIGASYAAKYGAVATVVRSMTNARNNSPHTGNMKYDTAISKLKIPALALSYVAADRICAEFDLFGKVKLHIETFCKTFPDAPSFNVIGEIKGSEKPNEYIISGGHLDSWDNGQGAHDDGAGIVQTIDVMGMFKKMGIKPRHTIRTVCFMNEENGLGGANAYFKEADEKKLKHIAALETDAGGYTPRGFGVDTTKGMHKMVSKWAPLFKPYFIEHIKIGGGGADIGPLEKLGVPCIGFEPDNQRYFDIHHTADDTFDKVNKRELELGASAIGSLIYLIDKYHP